MANKDLESLIIELQKGSIRAYESLFELYYNRVKHFAFGFIKNKDESEEIAQNVFYKLWVNRKKIRENESLESYLFTITRNEIHDFFRTNSYEILYRESLLNADENIEYEIDSEFNIQEIKAILQATIEKMPEQRRLVFKMSREKFLSNDEIAKTLSLSKRTVEKHLSLALRTIKEQLGDFLFFVFLFFIH